MHALCENNIGVHLSASVPAILPTWDRGRDGHNHACIIPAGQVTTLTASSGSALKRAVASAGHLVVATPGKLGAPTIEGA